MYRHFLNKNDYLAIITETALEQLTRGKDDRLVDAELAAESTIVDYLTENYEIENELNRGKFIAEYNRMVSYPVGSFFYFEGKICEAIKSINGYKAPGDTVYWKLTDRMFPDEEKLTRRYSQMYSYQPGDYVCYLGIWYECVEANGYDFGNVRIPDLYAWSVVPHTAWEKNTYQLWEVVEYEGKFFTLMSEEDYDPFEDPMTSKCWGLIGDYDSSLDSYKLEFNEYVAYEGKVYYPTINPNAETPVLGVNIRHADPRNYNLIKHMRQLALYELHKLVSPNNVSSVRISDYDHSIQWLKDASRLKLNPQIPRKIDKRDNLPVTDWQLATFQTSYNPYNNPWQI